MKKEIKEDYKICKCGWEVETLKNWGAEGYTTATYSIQKCKKCGRYRKIKGDAGEPMKLLEESMEEITDKQINNSKPWLFQPGQSGNPKGRPKGQVN